MSTVITPEDLAALAPEFEEVDETRAQLYIELAQDFIAEGAWGSRYKRGVLLIAAHLLTLTDDDGDGAQVVTSESVGDLTRTYAASSDAGGGSGDWARTKWGVLFQQLSQRIFTTPMVV